MDENQKRSGIEYSAQPHSWNIANAMYGFLELGAEIVSYQLIDDIYDRVTRDDIVLDYIRQCNMIFSKFGVNPDIPDYPESLKSFLGRSVWKDTINSISCDETKWSAGYFIKPVRSKVFTGKIVRSLSDLVGCGNQYEDYEVIVSEPIDILAEWRCFILYDQIIDVRPYGSLSESGRYRGYKYHYDYGTLQGMMRAFRNWEGRPVACSMDVCRTSDGRTLLIEMNDAYSLGCYGLPGVLYAKMLSARWSQLLGREDEYCF